VTSLPTEAWQRGPLPDVDPILMPVAHSFVQVKEDLDRLAACVSEDQLWQRPNGAVSIGFHIRHIAGRTERLLAYARGDALTPDQLDAARAEAEATALHFRPSSSRSVRGVFWGWSWEDSGDGSRTGLRADGPASSIAG